MALCPTDAIAGGIKVFPLQEAKVADIVGSTYNALFGAGTLVFPIIGSAVVKGEGFRLAIDIISIALLLNGLIGVSGLYDCRLEEGKERENDS